MARNLYILAATLLLFALVSCGMTSAKPDPSARPARKRLAVEDDGVFSSCSEG